MASYYTIWCEECNFKCKTSGPHEYQLSRKKMKLLPHPSHIPADGILLNVFCPKCMKNNKKIIVEFKNRCDNPWEVPKAMIKAEYLNNYRGWIAENPKKNDIPTECFNYDSAKCPECGQLAVFFNNIACPKCGKDKLVGQMESIT